MCIRDSFNIVPQKDGNTISVDQYKEKKTAACAMNNSAGLGTESQVISTSSSQEDESPAQTL